MVEAAILKAGGGEVRPASSLPKRHLLVLANKARGLAPGQRFRFEQWAPRLARDHGIELDLLPFESRPLTEILYKPGHRPAKAFWVSFDFLRRAKALLALRNYDAIVVFREAALIGPAIYERLIAWSGKPIIFDFDDSIWSQSQLMNNGIFSRLHFFGKTSTLCRLASAVSAGNPFLADYAAKRNRNTFVVPTSIELDDYPVFAEPQKDDPFVICWTGSTSTLAHFELAREALEQLASRIPIAVKIICNQPPKRPIAGAEMRFIPWSAEGEARAVGESHAGIMPLPDNEVSRGKCGLKALQCMATGRPVVISPVGVNIELITHGDNGFLAATTEEYVEALLKLAQSRELRARLGANARKTVEDGYSARAAAARFASVVRSVTDA